VGIEAQDEAAGSQAQCRGCGTALVVPLDLPCDGPTAGPGMKTLQLAELAALTTGLRCAAQR
jgi:hypothetical protein